MQFKLDECVDVRLKRLFEDAGHDVETVFSEKLAGAPDKSLYDICLKEKRAPYCRYWEVGYGLQISAGKGIMNSKP